MNKVAVGITGILFVLFFVFSFQRNASVTVDSGNLTTIEQTTDSRRRTDYVDENGVITMHPTNGYATRIQILDERENPVEEYYLDAEGNPVERSEGYYGIMRIYDQEDLCIQYTYVDQEGKPIRISSGYASVRQVYDENRRVKEVYYLDEKDDPCPLYTGQYGERREYDEDGRNIRTIYIDQDGNPMENQKGYSSVVREYNEGGQITMEWYYDLDEKKVDIGRGQYGSKRLYEDGVYISSVAVDEEGNELFFFDQLLQKNPWIVAISGVLFLIIPLFLNRKLRIGLVVVYIGFILYMTLFVRESGDQKSNLELFWSYRLVFERSELGLEILNNIWLFLPFGAMLCSLEQEGKWKIWFIALGLTICIECIQYIFGLGLCELDDIISNSLGAWLGWGCYREVRRWKRKKN